jgi:hypothetical protein
VAVAPTAAGAVDEGSPLSCAAPCRCKWWHVWMTQLHVWCVHAGVEHTHRQCYSSRRARLATHIWGRQGAQAPPGRSHSL